MSIKRKIYDCLPESVKIAIFKIRQFDKPCGYGEVYSVTLNKAFDTFLTPEEKADKKIVKELTDDIIRCWLRYQALPYEYFSYDLMNCDDAKRATYMTDVQKNSACIKYSGLEPYLKEISDKYAFYQLMQPFFGRKVFHVEANTDKNQFMAFAIKVKRLFCKNNLGSRGSGAFAAEVNEEKDAAILFEQLTQNAEDDWIIEERIVQSKEMAQWNPSCVNTVRLPAFMTKCGFKVLDPFFRTGRAGSIVDNAGQGGVFAGIDPETGVIISDGVDELGHSFATHPDSGLTFKGWQVPRWKELLETAEKAHRTIPHHKYIGWDFALTDKGWVLIEGNWGQMVGQYATKVGVKKEFMQYIQN